MIVPTALFARAGARVIRTTHEGGRARQALHQHLALHEVRRREPVLPDRPPGRRRLHATCSAQSARTTRAPRTFPGPGFAAGPCLFKDTMQLAAFTRDHFPMGQAAMQVNEGMPAYIVTALERRYGSLRGRTVGILGMAFKAESDDTAPSLSFKLRKLLAWAGARVLCTDPYVPDDRLLSLDASARRERDRRHRCSAPRLPRPRARRHARWSTSGAHWARASGCMSCMKVLRHRRGRLHLRLPGAGAPRGRPRGRRRRRLQQVRAGREDRTTSTRATASSRATRRTWP